MQDHQSPKGEDDVLNIDWEDLVSPDSVVPVAPLPPPAPGGQDAGLPAADAAQAGLPMVRGGTCQRCGYALRPLEDTCPRCKHLPPSSAGEQRTSPSGPEQTADFIPSGVPFPSRRRSPGFRWIGGLAALIAVGTAVGAYVSLSPRVQAARAYRLGLQFQLRADFAAARAHYSRALELDPTMGLAAFSLGTTYLGMGDPAMATTVQELTNRAISGQTTELDQADWWFRHAIQIADRLPPNRHLMDARISTPLRLKAYAHSCLALTALIRASAGLQADSLDDGMAWLQVAGREAQAALLADPENAAAQAILKRVTPSL